MLTTVALKTTRAISQVSTQIEQLQLQGRLGYLLPVLQMRSALLNRRAASAAISLPRELQVKSWRFSENTCFPLYVSAGSAAEIF